jgi:hypothetical protein
MRQQKQVIICHGFYGLFVGTSFYAQYTIFTERYLLQVEPVPEVRLGDMTP